MRRGAIALAIALVAAPALADGGVGAPGNATSTPPAEAPAERPPEPIGCVCVGPIIGPQASNGPGWTIGADLALLFFAAGTWRQGGFAQVQRYFGSGASMRYAAGFEISGRLGVELGAAVRTGEAGTTPSLHVAPFATAGPVALAIRVSPGIGVYGSELAMMLSLKWPFLFGD